MCACVNYLSYMYTVHSENKIILRKHWKLRRSFPSIICAIFVQRSADRAGFVAFASPSVWFTLHCMFCLVCLDCLNQCEVPSMESKQTSECYAWLLLDLFILLKS